MIKSMTGYGKSEEKSEFGTLSVELTSVNSRYLDTSFKLPDFLDLYSNEFRNIIKEIAERGRIKVIMNFEMEKDNSRAVSLNSDLLRQYYTQLSDFRKEMGIEQEFSIGELLKLPEIASVSVPDIDAKELAKQASSVLKKALNKLDEMRIVEGDNLAEDIKAHLKLIETVTRDIEQLSAANKEQNLAKYKAYLSELTSDVEVEPDRLIQEAAIMSKKMDITEECARLYSHLSQFEQFFKSQEPSGKRMTFILQEMNREITTIGSKGECAEISHKVVEVKNELEKIREQAQNIL